jgi:hypothetical protein
MSSSCREESPSLRAPVKGGAVKVLYVLAAVVVIGSVVVIGLVLVVSAGIRREEREWSLCRKRAPSLAAWVARRVGGLYVKKTEPEEPGEGDPEHPLAWYERCV